MMLFHTNVRNVIPYLALVLFEKRILANYHKYRIFKEKQLIKMQFVLYLFFYYFGSCILLLSYMWVQMSAILPIKFAHCHYFFFHRTDSFWSYKLHFVVLFRVLLLVTYTIIFTLCNFLSSLILALFLVFIFYVISFIL